MPTTTTAIRVRPNPARSRTCARLLALIAGSALAAPVAAQDALGDGRALDASLAPGTRYNAPRPDFMEELRFRNAVVTGNAPGGLSFRGDVGYAAPYEFRGELGSDDLYAFRRDSLYSGLAGMGIRGTEAVQYQMALTTGARLPLGVMGSLVVPRDPASALYAGPGATGYAATGAPPIAPATPEAEVGGLYGQLRSTSAYTANRPYSPFLLTTIDRGEGMAPYAVTATPLRGIKASEMDDPAQQVVRLYEQRTRDAIEGAPPPNPAMDTSTAVESTRMSTAYDEVLRQIRERGAERDRLRVDVNQPPTMPGTDPGQIQPGQAQRGQTQPGQAQPGQAQPGQTQPGQTAPADPRAQWERDMEALRDRLVNGDPPAPQGEAPAAVPGEIRFDPSTMELIKPSGEPVSHLVNPEALSTDVYVQHVKTGERMLAAGKYFDAEERFTRALSVRPGDVTAQVGRVHAQLGAGMFLSAALNLRTTLIGAPTIAGTRYAPALLPTPQRVSELLLTLRENLGLEQVAGVGVSVGEQAERESALLLAYLGFQIGDETAVRQGLAAFKERIGPDASGRTSVDQRLAAMLEQLWLDGSAGE